MNSTITVSSVSGAPTVVVSEPRAFGANGKALSEAIFAELKKELPNTVHPNAV